VSSLILWWRSEISLRSGGIGIKKFLGLKVGEKDCEKKD